MPQKVQFFTGTVLNNLCAWDENPDRGRLNAILVELDLLNLIDNLPDGLETLMGIDGWQFTNGQSQMFGLARILYINPEIVLLDEPDVSLDEHYLEIFNKTLVKLKAASNTIILVTHRQSLIAQADTVVEIRAKS